MERWQPRLPPMAQAGHRCSDQCRRTGADRGPRHRQNRAVTVTQIPSSLPDITFFPLTCCCAHCSAALAVLLCVSSAGDKSWRQRLRCKLCPPTVCCESGHRSASTCTHSSDGADVSDHINTKALVPNTSSPTRRDTQTQEMLELTFKIKQFIQMKNEK